MRHVDVCIVAVLFNCVQVRRVLPWYHKVNLSTPSCVDMQQKIFDRAQRDPVRAYSAKKAVCLMSIIMKKRHIELQVFRNTVNARLER